MKIIIVYELRERELDIALLLKNGLGQKGFEVEIIEKQLMFKWKYSNAIIIVPNSYNSNNYDFYNYSLNSRNNFIINLQIEQVWSKKNEDNGYTIPRGKALKEIICCWGPYTYNYLLDKGIDENKLKITGAIQLDFLNKKFNSFWYSRDELSSRYKLPNDKKWFLYISSFSYVNNSNIVSNLQKDLGGDKAVHVRDFEMISTESHKITLDWFEQLLDDNADYIFIYRPHPVENSHPRLMEIKEKYPNNFYIINELNIKQWLLVADQIVTWFSTSIVESFHADKMCHILRPIPIPAELDAQIYNGATNILDSYDKLSEIVNENVNINDMEFPVEIAKINEYYLVDDTPSYLKLIDIIEELAVSKKEPLEKLYLFKRWKFILSNNILTKYYLKLIYKYIYDKTGFKIKNSKLRDKFAFKNLEKNIDNKQFYKNDLERKDKILKKIVGLEYEVK